MLYCITGEVVEDIESPGVLMRNHVEIPGFNLRKVEFPRVIRKKSCGMSMGLGFFI